MCRASQERKFIYLYKHRSGVDRRLESESLKASIWPSRLLYFGVLVVSFIYPDNCCRRVNLSGILRLIDSHLVDNSPSFSHGYNARERYHRPSDSRSLRPAQHPGGRTCGAPPCAVNVYKLQLFAFRGCSPGFVFTF